MSYKLYYTNESQKDAKKIKKSGLKSKAEKLLGIIAKNPYKSPPSYEKLVGDLEGALSRRINIQHHLVYQVCDKTKRIKILRMWTHYE